METSVPEERIVLYTLGLVAFLLIVVVSYNNMMAKQARERGPAPKAERDEEDTSSWLCKFALHDGNVVGETLAVDGDRLILKQAGVFKSVRIEQARIEGEEVVLRGDIDWDAAIESGTAWHQANTKGQDDLVSAQLTTSADVRAPALDAMKEREGPSAQPIEADSEE